MPNTVREKFALTGEIDEDGDSDDLGGPAGTTMTFPERYSTIQPIE